MHMHIHIHIYVHEYTHSSQKHNLPLHCACEAGAPLEVVQLLLQRNPHAAAVKNMVGGGLLGGVVCVMDACNQYDYVRVRGCINTLKLDTV